MIMHSVVLVSSMPILDSSKAKWLARLHPTFTNALRGNVGAQKRSDMYDETRVRARHGRGKTDAFLGEPMRLSGALLLPRSPPLVEPRKCVPNGPTTKGGGKGDVAEILEQGDVLRVHHFVLSSDLPLHSVSTP